mmetsp:Transcript_17107/g.40805  ORF Transcript_17107/g.40805 Transcript_17107/m.40805 type:complete len:219 (+) Transcript_17107:841-1497(+)
MRSRLVKRRRAASSSSCGRFVAPITRIRESALVPTPSNWTKNSVFNRRDASCSPSERAVSRESTSSMKIMEGCRAVATANNARTSFSPTPCHLEVRDDAEMEKKVHDASVATAFASIVLPVPGGPNNSRPRGGARMPVKISGRVAGRMTISSSCAFAVSSPAILSQHTDGLLSRISSMIIFCISLSTPFSAASAAAFWSSGLRRWACDILGAGSDRDL